ncbi:MAG: hypothetical protein FD166_1174 [Bacteroidetes bacterium]|nr:MAG: hypothetical protein FD166_1174 [Bacteroidota bacterium]
MKIVAFNTRKPKPFNYKPLYYDKKKEEMEERMKKYTNPEEQITDRMRSRIRETWRIREKRNNVISKRTLYIYLVAAFVIIYFIFFR